MNTVLIVDALNLFIRHFVAHPAMNENGEPIGGVIGFLYTLVNISEKYNPDKIYVVWESGGSIRKRAIQKDYKSMRRPQKLNRAYDDHENTIDNRNYQINLIIDVLKNTPICQIYVKDCEADDVIGHICKNVFKEDRKVIISSDRDYYQLLDNKTIIYSPTWKKLVTSKEIKEKFKISPVNFCLAKCIAGDPSDNIKGIEGVSYKTLSKRYSSFLSDEFLSIERLIEESEEELKKGSKIKTYEKIKNGKDTIFKNWKLIYLDTNNISSYQILKVNSIIETFKPQRNKIEAIRFFIKHGIKNFNFDRAFLSFSKLKG